MGGVIVTTSGATSGGLLTAKGDLVTRTGSGTVRLPVGVDGQVLVADSTKTNGIAWEGVSNEVMASRLVAGGPVGISTHFMGTSIEAGWNDEANAATSRVQKNSVLAIDANAAVNHQQRAFAPGASTAFRHEARLHGWDNSDSSPGILIRDSGSGDASGHGMLMTVGNGTFQLYSLDAGVYTSRASYTLASTLPTFWPVYLRLDRDAADLWTGYFSYDRAIWTQVGTYTKVVTVAKCGLRLYAAVTHKFFAIDFYDEVS